MKKLHILLFLGLGCLACHTEAPQLPKTVASWQDYDRPEHGYSLKVPSYFLIEEDDSGARFRYDGHPSISLSYTTEEVADGRGLWPGNEFLKEVDINERHWKMYIYNHSDGLFYMRVVSFVTELNDKYLAVEFRIDGDLRPIHREVMKSVNFSK